MKANTTLIEPSYYRIYDHTPRQELVKVYAWKTDNMTVEHEAKVFIRKGWMRFIPRFIYDAFAEPDAEFSGSTPFSKWKGEEGFIKGEFETNNAVLDSLFDQCGVDFRFELVELLYEKVDSNGKIVYIQHSKDFANWPDEVIELN